MDGSHHRIARVGDHCADRAVFHCSSGVHAIQGYNAERVFREVRQRLGRGILLGLEFLIAADIILTVAIDLTFESVGVLALIVLVRTFLSFTLEVELTGSWPWQGSSQAKDEPKQG